MGRFEKASEIKTGVIGYGPSFNIAQNHLRNMKRVGMVPAAVADIDPERLPVAKADFPEVDVFPSATDMLKSCNLDLIAVVTPHDSHAELALECLEAGCHVITEKPFCITTEECDEVIASAREKNLMLSVHHNRHWDGCILKALEKIRSGLIGDIIRVEARQGRYGKPRDWWRSNKRISGGILYDWGAHFLEYALQVLDDEMTEVNAVAKTGYWADKTPFGQDTNEDEVFTTVRFAGGRWLTLRITHIDSIPKRGWLEITGTRGSYVFSGRDWYAVTHEGDATVRHKGPNPPSEGGRFYDNILAHLTHGEDLVITPEWARRPIHILDLTDQSILAGEAVKTTYA